MKQLVFCPLCNLATPFISACPHCDYPLKQSEITESMKQERAHIDMLATIEIPKSASHAVR